MKNISFFSIFLLGLLTSFGSIVKPILPQYVEMLGASYIEVGLFFSIYSLIWSIIQLYTGYLSDKYGRRKLAVLGFLLYGISLIFMGFSQNFIQLIVFRVLQGIGLGFFGPAILGLIAQVKEKGKGFAFYRVANGLGLMLGPIIGGVLGEMNIRYPFFISGLLSLSTIVSLLPVHEKKGYVEFHVERGFFKSLREIILYKKIILTCISVFMVELAFASLDIIIPLFCSFQGISTTEIGLILSSYFITFTIFQIPIGVISEKVNRKLLMILCTFSGSLPFFALTQFHKVFEIYLAMGLLGVTLGTVFVQSSAYIAELSPKDKKSLYMAFFDSIIDYSFIIMPPIASYTFTYTPTAPFTLCAVIMIIATIILIKA